MARWHGMDDRVRLISITHGADFEIDLSRFVVLDRLEAQRPGELRGGLHAGGLLDVLGEPAHVVDRQEVPAELVGLDPALHVAPGRARGSDAPRR